MIKFDDIFKKLITPELFSKIGLITKQIQVLTDELENLIVHIDEENPVQLTRKDQERIENSAAAKKLFTTCFPYIFAQNMLMTDNTK